MSPSPSRRVPPTGPPARRPNRRATRLSGTSIRRLAAAATLLGAAALPGCGESTVAGDHPLTGPPRTATRPVEWPFWPRDVRIHPLTRLLEEPDGTTYVEARVEFLDRSDDGTKASGSLELALFDERRGREERQVIDFWRADLVDARGTARNFDPVTRTYLFKLAVVPEVFELAPVLYVRHDSVDGRTMLDRMELRTAP